MSTNIVLNGSDLSLDQIVAAARGDAVVALDPAMKPVLDASRRVVDEVVVSDQAVYGINTGFGKLASVIIPRDDVALLQKNLIRSHASGMGDSLPTDVVRALMLLRANSLLKPTSGVRWDVPQLLVDMLNAGLHPIIPELGSVGASGDLAPLAHLALSMMGEGAVAGGAAGSMHDALTNASITPIEFAAKEGLACINGTQAQTAMLSLLVHDAEVLWHNTVAVASLSLDALKGSTAAFDPRLHEARPHPGQIETARLMADWLDGSAIRESHRHHDPRVQDAYSVRCAPQVLGSVKDTIEFVRRVLTIEINSATDNPLVLGTDIVSGGNFHGQPIAMALDYLSIALTTLAGLCERRLERLVNPDLSGGLPAFLARQPGLESGFMVVQIGAAALVGECRALCAPASIQSVPTDANQEDFVPMSMAAARKARTIAGHAARVVASELLCAAEALEYHRPLTSSTRLETLHVRVRKLVAPLTGDRTLTGDLEMLTTFVTQEVWT